MHLFLCFVGIISVFILFRYIKKELNYSKKETILLVFLQSCFWLCLCLKIKNPVLLFIYLLFVNIFFFMVLTDLKTKLVSSLGLQILFVLSLIYVFYFDRQDLIFHVFAMFFAGLPLWLLNFFYKESIGEGDINLIGILGLFLKDKIFYLMSVSYFLAGLYSIYLCVIVKKSRKSEIAMFPFFYVGFCITILINLT